MERREGMRAREKGVFMMRRGSQEAHCWRTAGGGGRTPAAAQWMQEHMYHATCTTRCLRDTLRYRCGSRR